MTPASRRFQFYIRDMFVWTTTIAVFLSAWYTVPNDAFGGMNRSEVGIALLVLASVAGVSTFSALVRGWIVVRVALLPIVVGLAAASLKLYADGESFWYFTIILSTMAFWLVASFLVLRFAGYRLAWRPRLEQPQEDIAA